MNNVKFLTLAQARLQDPAAFDAAIEHAVMVSAQEVGLVAIARALSQPMIRQEGIRSAGRHATV